jgi:phosphatidate phosphatase APP1
VPGVSVVSDIDDTVKASNVVDRSDLLPNTFLRPFEPSA